MQGKEKAKHLFSHFIGEKARNVTLGHGSFITMDFGKDLLLQEKIQGKIKEYTQGEWHLWIIMSAWRLDKSYQPLIGSGDERTIIKEKLPILENSTLKDVVILNNSFDMILQFNDDIQLLLFSQGVEEDKQWMLFTPEQNIFRAGPGSQWSYSS